MSWRPSLRFSLRALLIAVLLFGVLSGFAARWYSRGERQKQIVATATAAGGHIQYDFEHYKNSRWYAPARWLAPRIGADQVGNVMHLGFPTTDISRWRAPVASAVELQSIETFDACSMDLNDDDIRQLARFQQMKELGFAYVQNAPNLQPLAELPHLEKLAFHSSRVFTATNLKPLQSAPRLRTLNLAGTEVTDEVVPILATFPHLEELHVEDTLITPAALAGLKASKSLKRLHVEPRQQSAKESLPGVEFLLE